jgi:hypothetical protein
MQNLNNTYNKQELYNLIEDYSNIKVTLDSSEYRSDYAIEIYFEIFQNKIFSRIKELIEILTSKTPMGDKAN